jgi:hypothetical protein
MAGISVAKRRIASRSDADRQTGWWDKNCSYSLLSSSSALRASSHCRSNVRAKSRQESLGGIRSLLAFCNEHGGVRVLRQPIQPIEPPRFVCFTRLPPGAFALEEGNDLLFGSIPVADHIAHNVAGWIAIGPLGHIVETFPLWRNAIGHWRCSRSCIRV